MRIPLGYAHVVYKFITSGVGRKAAITHGVQLTGTDFGEARAADLYDLFVLEVMPSLTSNVSLQSVLVKYGPSSSGPAFEHGGSAVGGFASAGMAPNSAYLVRKRTALGGRANRGRLYLPGVAEAAVDESGNIDPSGLQTNINDWFAGLSALGMPMYLLHTGSSDPTDVSNLVVDSKIATQRRRLR